MRKVARKKFEIVQKALFFITKVYKLEKTTQKLTLKKTHKQILEIITQNCALNAYEIFERLKKTNPKNISQTTVYRALNFLVENFFIKPVSLNDGHTRYEIINPENHHHHFICTECKKLFPLDYCPYGNAENLLPEGFTVKFHNFEVFGLCAKCHQQ